MVGSKSRNVPRVPGVSGVVTSVQRCQESVGRIRDSQEVVEKWEYYHTQAHVAKGSGKVRNGCNEVSRGKVLRLHTVFRVLTQSEDLVSSLHSIYSSTGG